MTSCFRSVLIYFFGFLKFHGGGKGVTLLFPNYNYQNLKSDARKECRL